MGRDDYRYADTLYSYFIERGYFKVNGKVIIRGVGARPAKKENIRLIKDIMTELFAFKITNKLCEDMLEWIKVVRVNTEYTSNKTTYHVVFQPHSIAVKDGEFSWVYVELNEEYIIQLTKAILSSYYKCSLDNCNKPAGHEDRLCLHHREEVDRGDISPYLYSKYCIVKGCNNLGNTQYDFCIDHAVKVLNDNSTSRKKYIVYMRGDLYRDGIISKCKECRLVMNSEICTGCGKPATLHKDVKSIIKVNTTVLENYEKLYGINVSLNITKEYGVENTQVYFEDFGFVSDSNSGFGFSSDSYSGFGFDSEDKVQRTGVGLGSFGSLK